MRKIRTGFTETEIRLLESNLNVSRVSGRNISYAPAFNLAAVQANTAGEPPMEIFLKQALVSNSLAREHQQKASIAGERPTLSTVRLAC
ncbi:hypothetical protein [Paenibacillus periandrae]|uniref:hypothetical protein n=1 Tax=Paenibacillus periandrae TaxID=1761741 RepID=UPI001F098030|nr:hypothetical protein [Paenibacillus periandrae]